MVRFIRCFAAFPQNLSHRAITAAALIGVAGVCTGLAACSEPEQPMPVIFDLVDGVVTTEMFDEVPLEQYGSTGVTHLMLVPTGETANDPVLGPLSSAGLAHAVAAGNYSMGFIPDVYLAPNSKRGQFTATPAASLANSSVMGFDSTTTAEAMAARLTSEFAGKRIFLVGEPTWLASVGQIVSGGAMSTWPEPAGSAVAFVARAPNGAASVQKFGVNVRRE